MSTIYDWSLRASDNMRADDLIDWSEGQPPSTVNNSARFMMQRVREYLTDTGGVLEGTVIPYEEDRVTAIILRSQSRFLEYKDGIVLRFMATGTNVGHTAIFLNSLDVKPVYKATETGVSRLVGGEIQQGCVYSLVYSGNGWQLMNPTPVVSQEERSLYPPGFIGTFGMRDVPEDWLVCNGRAYSRTRYAGLFAAIGTVWGEGDGTSTFNVPDLRGMFLRGLDSGRNIDPNRRFASNQGDLIQSHQHSGQTLSREHFTDKENYWHGNSTDILNYQLRGFLGRFPITSLTGIDSDFIDDYISEPYHIDETHEVVLEKGGDGDSETRPINVSVVFAIKT